MKRIVDAAEGNPLYVEQMLAMLIDTGRATGRWRVGRRSDAGRHRSAAHDPCAARGTPGQSAAQ